MSEATIQATLTQALEGVVRDGSIITAVGPRDAGGFAQHISAALAEAAAQNAK